MANQSLPATARLTAAGRAVETRRSDRLFDDPLAEVLAGEEGFRLMERWRLPGAPRENPTIGPRTRFYDDLVCQAAADGIEQVVLVAAGMDTRAFRLALPSEVTIFEVDLEELLAQKQTILEQAHAEPRCRRVVVATDVADPGWPRALIAGGFERAARTVFVVEGLSWYLTEEEDARLLDDLAGLAASGSRLGIDIISRAQLTSPSSAPFFSFTASLGVLWQFGTDDPAGFLAAHGWQAEVTDLELFARRLGRGSPDRPPQEPDRSRRRAKSQGERSPARLASVLLH